MMNFHQNGFLNNKPATQALDHDLSVLEYPRQIASILEECRYRSNARKRRKLEFGVEEMLQVLKPIEDSISFPSIIWEFDDCRWSSRSQNLVQTYVHVNYEAMSAMPSSRHSNDLYETFSPKQSQNGGLVRSKSVKLSLTSLITDKKKQL
jgi:hypothetical protein